MANTIKFGNGQWATKEDSILAYNDENANFKPLPFVASRTSTATRVNKAGLLETVGVGIPRVDYLSNTSGAYLLEPSSTNLITQSEAFGNSYWTKSGASIEGDASTAGSEEVVNGDNEVALATLNGVGFTSSTASTFAQSTTQKYSGTYSLKITAGGANMTSFIIPNDATLNGKFIKVEGYVFIPSSNTSLSSIDILARTNGTDTANREYSVLDSWQYFEIYYQHGSTPSSDRDLYLAPSSGQSVTIGDIVYLDNVSVKKVQGFSAPSVDTPLSAFKLVGSTENSVHQVRMYNSSATTQTFSFFAKKGESRYLQIASANNTQQIANFDLQEGIISYNGSLFSNVKIDSFNDGWYRLSVASDNQNNGFRISIISSGTSTWLESWVMPNDTDGVYIFGAQLEQNSSATSYIPTSGTTISRTADSASKSGISSLINSSEGVFYMHISAFSNGGSDREISLSDGTGNNVVAFYFNTIASKMTARIRLNSVYHYFETTGINQTDLNKIAIRYSANDYSLWINGVNVAQNTNVGAFPSNTLNSLSSDFALTGSNKFYGNSKDLQVYKTALTDAELTTLTSYSSFNEMALALNYKIQ